MGRIKYHICPDYTVARCHAYLRPCPYGDDLHFVSEDEAIKRAQELMEEKYFSDRIVSKRSDGKYYIRPSLTIGKRGFFDSVQPDTRHFRSVRGAYNEIRNILDRDLANSEAKQHENVYGESPKVWHEYFLDGAEITRCKIVNGICTNDKHIGKIHHPTYAHAKRDQRRVLDMRDADDYIEGRWG